MSKKSFPFNDSSEYDLFNEVLLSSTKSHDKLILSNLDEDKHIGEKIPVSYFLVKNTLEKLIKEKENNLLDRFFDKYEVYDLSQNIDSLSNTAFNAKSYNIFDIFIKNNISVSDNFYYDIVLKEKPKVDFLSFLLQSKHFAKKTNIYTNIYANLIKNISNKDSYYLKAVELMHEKIGKKTCDEWWNLSHVQYKIIFKSCFKDFKEINKITPKNTSWKDFVSFLLAPRSDLSVSTSDYLIFLDASNEIDALKRDVDDYFKQSKDTQDSFNKEIKKNIKHIEKVTADDVINQYNMDYSNTEAVNILNPHLEDMVSIMSSWNSWSNGSDLSQLLYFPPSNINEYAVSCLPNLIKLMSCSKEGQDVIKSSFQKKPILFKFLFTSQMRNVCDVLSVVDMDDWRDKNNNTLAHYMVLFLSDYRLNPQPDIIQSLSSFIEKKPELFLVENIQNKTPIHVLKDLVKAKMLDENVCLSLENLATMTYSKNNLKQNLQPKSTAFKIKKI